jgi:hypothetical protein
LHDKIALQYFNAFYKYGLFVGQMRTRLGIAGYERSGPAEAANALLALIRGSSVFVSRKSNKKSSKKA